MRDKSNQKRPVPNGRLIFISFDPNSTSTAAAIFQHKSMHELLLNIYRFIKSGKPPENNANTYILSIKSLKLTKFMESSTIPLKPVGISKFQRI